MSQTNLKLLQRSCSKMEQINFCLSMVLTNIMSCELLIDCKQNWKLKKII